MREKTFPVVFFFQSARTGNKFLQRGVFFEIENKLATTLSDPELNDFINAKLNGKDVAIPTTEEFGKSFLLSLHWGIPSTNLSFLKELKKCYPDSKAMIILRSQYSSYPSFYKYAYIKIGGKEKYSRFFDEFSKGQDYDYFDSVKNLIDVFGREKVLVLFFEDMKVDLASYITTIFKYIGVEASAADIDFNKMFKNASRSDTVIRLGRFVNRFTTPLGYLLPVNMFERIRDQVNLETIRFLGWTKCFKMMRKPLCDDTAIPELIRKRYAESNKKLFELLDIDTEKYDYPQ